MKEWIYFAIVLLMLALMTYLFSGCFRTEFTLKEFVEVDKESLLMILPEGYCHGTAIPEIQQSVFYCKGFVDYTVCEGDTWINIAGVSVDILEIVDSKFRWRVTGGKETYTKRYRCGENNRPDLCGRLMKRGEGKCVTWNCRR